MSNGRKSGRGLQALLGLEDEEMPAVPVHGASPALMTLHGAAPTSAPPTTQPLASPQTPPSPRMNEEAVFAPIDVTLIDPNPFQPRREFPAAEIRELADSIRAHGMIQPVTVRAEGERYQLIAGERRFRAAQMAGLERLPARVLEVTDQQVFEIALIENLQRVDLNAIEKAQAFERYIGQFNVTHEKLAGQLGIDRSTVTNLLRLLELPDPVRKAVESGAISAGHARALLSLDDSVAQLELCRQIIHDGLSVRDIERMVREQRTRDAAAGKSAGKAPVPRSAHVAALENTLRQTLGTKVDIQQKAKDRGTIVIHFGSTEEFERVVQHLQGM